MDALPRNDLAEQAADHDRWVDGEQGLRGCRAVETADFGHRSTSALDRRARLARTLETEIIPRLMLAHRVGGSPESNATARATALGCREVDELAALALGQEALAAARYVDTVQSRGISFEALCLCLLAPTARRLGDMWEADLCDFTQVTIGLCRLQAVLRELGPDFPSEAKVHERGLRALLVPAPGEQHTLGLSMVTEFFRRAGWHVWGSPPATVDELRNLVASDWYDVAGLSISCASRIEALAASIRALRQSSRNPGIGVLVGGPLFVAFPEMVALVGADATTAVGAEAPLQAEKLVATFISTRFG